MKKNICIILIYTLAGILFFLLSYMVEDIDKNKPKILMDSIKEISMEIIDFSDNILTVEITDNTNKNKDSWHPRIEKKTDNTWQKIGKDNKGPELVRGPGFALDENNKIVKELDLQSEYGNLEKGIYRLISSAELYEYTQPYEFSVQFKIT